MEISYLDKQEGYEIGKECPDMSFGAFWSIWDVRSMEGLGMDAAQLDTQRKKEEAILKTSSTTYSTNRSSSSTRPAKLQLDRAEKSKSNPKNVASPLTFL
ncbi:unnamed protein product [Microthlaspi erraticum]|uniref:Uncharacterized protein n=1 Tax=Microthlaspi erraticum TaxID=1685480 RepID=A0A6D2HQF8_9BRAS|nr:unnamed protein product [Microthlaspi erraticum]